MYKGIIPSTFYLLPNDIEIEMNIFDSLANQLY